MSNEAVTRTNPFFETYDTPHSTVPFHRIQLSDYEEAFLEAGRRISFDEDQCKMIYQNIKEREKEVFQKEEFDKLGKIDYHRKKADENTTRRLIKTTLGKWKDEYKAQTI